MRRKKIILLSFVTLMFFLGLISQASFYDRQSDSIASKDNEIDKNKNSFSNSKTIFEKKYTKKRSSLGNEASSMEANRTWDEMERNARSLSMDSLEIRMEDLELVIDERRYIDRANAGLLDMDERHYFKKIMTELDVLKVIKIERKIARIKKMIYE